MPENFDEILLSAVERFKKGEGTPDDLKIIGQAIASQQIEITPAEESKIIGQVGGANFGEENEIRVSGDVVGTQTISGITGDQVLEILKLNEKEEDSDTKGIIAILGVVGIIVIALIVIFVINNQQQNRNTPVDTEPPTPVITTAPIEATPTESPESTEEITEKPTEVPEVEPPDSTEEPIAPTINPENITPEITETGVPSPTPNICGNQVEILVDKFTKDNVIKALNSDQPIEGWTDEVKKFVKNEFKRLEGSLTFKEVSAVEIIDNSIDPKATQFTGVCNIYFTVSFQLEDYFYSCNGKRIDPPITENIFTIDAPGSLARVRFKYDPDYSFPPQISEVNFKLSYDSVAQCEGF